MIIAWISSWLFKFYQLPNSNSFTHRLLFFSREATSKTYGLRVSSLIYLPLRSIFLWFLFSDLLNKKFKNTLLHFILFGVRSINLLQLSCVRLPIFGTVTRKGLTTPFTTSGCEYSLLQDVANATLRSETLRWNCVRCKRFVKKGAKGLRWRSHQTWFRF